MPIDVEGAAGREDWHFLQKCSQFRQGRVVVLAGVTIAVIVSVLWIGAQIYLAHLQPPRSRFKAMLAGYLASLPLVLGFYWLLPASFPNLWAWLIGAEHPLSALLHAFVSHLLIFFLYVECFYHVERSVTLRLLIEIGEHPGGETAEAISADYNVDGMIVQRIEALNANGYTEQSGDRIRLLPRGRRFAAGARAFCWLFQSKMQDERL
jgi:hypothetical protein